MKAKLVLVLTLLSVMGCASKPADEPKSYLLNAVAASSMVRSDQPARVALRRLDVASYLDQPGIVLALPDGAVQTARQHRWAEPLRDGLRRVLAYELSARLEAPVRLREAGAVAAAAPAEVVLDAEFLRFHLRADGMVAAEVSWSAVFLRAALPPMERVFYGELALRADGYAAVVEAHERLIGELARSMADALKGAFNGD